MKFNPRSINKYLAVIIGLINGASFNEVKAWLHIDGKTSYKQRNRPLEDEILLLSGFINSERSRANKDLFEANFLTFKTTKQMKLAKYLIGLALMGLAFVIGEKYLGSSVFGAEWILMNMSHEGEFLIDKLIGIICGLSVACFYVMFVFKEGQFE